MTDDPTLDDLNPIQFGPWTDPSASVCRRCGSIVQSGHAHDRWHRAIEANADLQLSQVRRGQLEELIDKVRAAGQQAQQGYANFWQQATRAAGTAPTPEAYQAATDALELRRVALVRILGLAPATAFHDAVNYVADLVRQLDESRGKSERLRLEVTSLTNGLNAMADALHGAVGGHPDAPFSTLVARARQQRFDLQRATDLVTKLRKHVDAASQAAERCRKDAGLHRGEVERLRRVESALLELGAPGHSTEYDPGGPMIRWIQEMAGKAISTEQRPDTAGLTHEVLTDLLSLVSVTVSPGQLAEWTPEQREQAAEWASLVHLSASDNDVVVPPRPAFLDEPADKAYLDEPLKAEFWDKAANPAEPVEPCPSLLLDNATLYPCQKPVGHHIDESDLHSFEWPGPTGMHTVGWPDDAAVPVPWPKDQEPPAGIDLLRDTSDGQYLCRETDGWVWWGNLADRNDTDGHAKSWYDAVDGCSGDLVVMRP
jgi:hypothetical protein